MLSLGDYDMTWTTQILGITIAFTVFSCGQPEVKNLRSKIGDGGKYEDTKKYEDAIGASLPKDIKIQVQSHFAPMFELPAEYISSPDAVKVYNLTTDTYMGLEVKKLGDVYRFYIVGGVEWGLNRISVLIGDLYDIPGEVTKRDFTYFGTLLTSQAAGQNLGASNTNQIRFRSWVNLQSPSKGGSGSRFVSGVMNVINQ